MAAWPWQIRPRSRCQSTHRTRFTSTRHRSRVANLLHYKVTHVSFFSKWRHDLVRYDQGRDANRLAVLDLPILDTTPALLACSVTKLRISKYLPKMAVWPWQLWSRSRCQSTRRTRFTHTRYWSRVASSLRYKVAHK